MSAKWQRVQAFDNEHLTGWLAPVRMVLFLFSSVRLAAVMLVGVAMYAVLASVPVGLLALIPTWLIYIASLVAASCVPGLVAAAFCKRFAEKKQLGRASAFLATMIPMLLIAAVGVMLWLQFIWPTIKYDHTTGDGLRLFTGFVETYASTTVRRLPALEMTELEFYAWWPMRTMLLIFTINLIIATIRRIEFKFVNLGVLTVHTGIVMIAIGSIYYQMFKQEGDTLLLAGGASQGQAGPAQAAFYDREDPALWIHAGMGWHQGRLPGLPRYNDYNLSAGQDKQIESLGPLNIPLTAGGLDTGLGEYRLRVIGFASYAEGEKFPEPVPADAQNGKLIGTHDKAMIAVEVSHDSSDWNEIVWLPHCKYTDVMVLRNSAQRVVMLPDGRQIALVFGRVQHRLPGFQIRMLDFTMLSYDHRGSPRDYQSLVRVEPTTGGFEPYDHITRLNAPLKAPFQWSSRRGFMPNLYGEIISHLSPAQYKFAQAGWDRAGWEQSQQFVDQGTLERPRASFTILGVGNSPGIHIIALGGVLMGVGTPWAFYVKPWLLRRQKRKIQAQLAEQSPKPEGDAPA